MKLVFEECSESCYEKGTAFIAGDYKVVHYDYSYLGGITEKKSNWHAYKRCPSGLFGNNVDQSRPEYKTRKQAESACQKDFRASIKS